MSRLEAPEGGAKLDCEQVRSRVVLPAGEAPSAGERAQIAAHVAGCPRCANLPGLDEVLGREERRPGTRAALTPRKRPAPPPAEASGALDVLLVFGAITALLFAGRSAAQVVEALQRPASTQGGSLPGVRPPVVGGVPGVAERRTSAGESEAGDPAERALRDACRRAHGYLERARGLDARRPEAAEGLSRELLKESQGSGLVAELRRLRGETTNRTAVQLRRMEMLFLRAAGAQANPQEWSAIQTLIQRYDLVKVCEGLSRRPAGEGER